MRIYAEWLLYGTFYNDFFTSWEAFFSATFNPDCKISIVKEVK